MENNKHVYNPIYWTKERNQWLIDNTKGMSRKDAYSLWCKTFPNENKSEVSVNNQRSRLKCASRIVNVTHSTKIKPLYSERIKTGYMQIKVAMPNVWWPKAKWIWINTHPEELDTLLETDAFYFADGNTNNFHMDNIIRVHRKEQTLFQFEGGVVPGDPELSKIHLLLARMKLARLDAAERCGDVVISGSGRKLRYELNDKARAYHKNRYRTNPEYRKKVAEAHHKRYLNLTPEQRKARAEYQKRWRKQKKQKELQNENKDL